jgi:hypothetical protein
MSMGTHHPWHHKKHTKSRIKEYGYRASRAGRWGRRRQHGIVKATTVMPSAQNSAAKRADRYRHSLRWGLGTVARILAGGG